MKSKKGRRAAGGADPLVLALIVTGLLGAGSLTWYLVSQGGASSGAGSASGAAGGQYLRLPADRGAGAGAGSAGGAIVPPEPVGGSPALPRGRGEEIGEGGGDVAVTPLPEPELREEVGVTPMPKPQPREEVAAEAEPEPREEVAVEAEPEPREEVAAEPEPGSGTPVDVVTGLSGLKRTGEGATHLQLNWRSGRRSGHLLVDDAIALRLQDGSRLSGRLEGVSDAGFEISTDRGRAVSEIVPFEKVVWVSEPPGGGAGSEGTSDEPARSLESSGTKKAPPKSGEGVVFDIDEGFQDRFVSFLAARPEEEDFGHERAMAKALGAAQVLDGPEDFAALKAALEEASKFAADFKMSEVMLRLIEPEDAAQSELQSRLELEAAAIDFLSLRWFVHSQVAAHAHRYLFPAASGKIDLKAGSEAALAIRFEPTVDNVLKEAAATRSRLGRLLTQVSAELRGDNLEAALDTLFQAYKLGEFDPSMRLVSATTRERIKSYVDRLELESSPRGDGILKVPGEYETIQAAIDAAGDGDLISIGPGTFREKLFILKPGIEIRLHGAGGERTRVQAPEKGAIPLLVSGSGGVEFSGITFEGAPGGAEAHIATVSVRQTRAEFENCTFRDGGFGVMITGPPVALFKNCEVRGCHAGMQVTEGATVALEGCTFRDNETIGAVTYVGELEANHCSFIENGVAGLVVADGGSGTVKRSRFVKNGQYGITVEGEKAFAHIQDNTCQESGKAEIRITQGAQATVTGNTCEDGNIGIVVNSARTRALVTENACLKNKFHGIAFALGAAGRVERNKCIGNKYTGISVFDRGTTPELIDNTANGNGQSGIWVQLEAVPAAFSGNVATGNKVKDIERRGVKAPN